LNHAFFEDALDEESRWWDGPIDPGRIPEDYSQMGTIKIFEVYLSATSDPETILSEEVREETMAQVMTDAEASAVGFQGIAPDPQGRARRWIAVAPGDAGFVQSRLDANPDVVGYRGHDVDS
jgi:hypothetical protein